MNNDCWKLATQAAISNKCWLKINWLPLHDIYTYIPRTTERDLVGCLGIPHRCPWSGVCVHTSRPLPLLIRVKILILRPIASRDDWMHCGNAANPCLHWKRKPSMTGNFRVIMKVCYRLHSVLSMFVHVLPKHAYIQQAPYDSLMGQDIDIHSWNGRPMPKKLSLKTILLTYFCSTNLYNMAEPQQTRWHLSRGRRKIKAFPYLPGQNDTILTIARRGICNE